MKKIFTQFFLFATLLLASTNLSAQTYNGGVWYSLYDATERTLKTSTWWEDKEIYNYTNIFTPSTGVLSFDTKMTKHLGITNPDPYKLSVNGTTVNVPAKQTSYLTCTTNVSADVTSVSFVYIFSSYNSERTLSIANVKLPLAQHILLSDSNPLDFAEQLLGEQSDVQTVNLRSFLSTGDITISSDNPAFRVGSADNTEALVWAVGANACASQNGADGALAGGETLGDIDQYQVAIYFCPQTAGETSGTITITDGTSTATIAVSGEGIAKVKTPQTIEWNDQLTDLTTNDTVLLTATAMTEVVYEVSDATIAKVEGNQLTFLAAGEVTISAIALENDDYLADTLSKTILVSEPLIELAITAYPTASTITYGQALSASVLEGGEATVEGVFEWVDGESVLDAGEHVMLAHFVPADQVYDTVEFEVEIEVLPAEQVISWEVEMPVVLEIGDTMQLTAVASSGLPVAYSLSEEGVLEVSDSLLVAIGVGSVTVEATQDGMGENGAYNYLPAEPVTYTIIVEIATGLENVQEAQVNVRKIVRDGIIYIIRGEQVYDMLGNRL